MGFPKQEHWSGLPFTPPGELPNPGKEPRSPVSPALADVFFTTAPPWETPNASDLFSHSSYNFIPCKQAHLGNLAAPLTLSPLALECQLWRPFNVKGNGSSHWELRMFRQGEKLLNKQTPLALSTTGGNNSLLTLFELYLLPCSLCFIPL